MIVIINGPPGIGKTSISQALLKRIEGSALIDGDSLAAMKSFNRSDREKLLLFFEAIRGMAEAFKKGGAQNLLIAFTFETPESLSLLKQKLGDLDNIIYSYLLTAECGEIERRIVYRGRSDYAKTLSRFRRITRKYGKKALTGDQGYPIECTGLSIDEAAAVIENDIRTPVEIVEYDPAWPEMYEQEKERLLELLGPLADEIHHVGSTSVPGLPAKPIIDIMIAVKKFRDDVKCFGPLRELGYIYVDFPQNTDRRFLRKGVPRTHHLHITESKSGCYARTLDFRDALRNDKALRERYGNLKKELSGTMKENRAEYTDTKTAMIEEAIAEYRRNKRKR